MKRILYLSFYFEPDLSAGSFRNTSLAKQLAIQIEGKAEIDIVTTLPNRYSTFSTEAKQFEENLNYRIHRILIPKHQSGMKDQILSFRQYYQETLEIVNEKEYDLVFASSSRLFTAYLGYSIAKKRKIPLYLDIRDIFTDTMKDVLDNSILKSGVLPILNWIENRVFNYASHINLISGGFSSYFCKYSNPKFSQFPNGIDDIFLNMPVAVSQKRNQRVITYAGNIGEGQGLHKIIPSASKRLGSDFKFQIIGDGGAKQKLIDELNRQKVDNVEMLPPVKRDELIKLYNDSDFLFIHLNNYEAFKKVLPSKIFELATFNKPIIAGVAGFSNKFIEEHIDNKILFMPGDVESMVYQLNSFQYKTQRRESFVEKFKRSSINREMAASIAAYI